MPGLRYLLLFFILLFSSFAFSQSRLYLALVERGEDWQWSVDLNNLTTGSLLVMHFDDSIGLHDWLEISDMQLGPLFNYALPRFTEQTDTFDCFTRELLNRDQSRQDTVGNKNMAIPGRKRGTEPPSRGSGGYSDMSGEWINGKYQVSLRMLTVPVVLPAVLRFRGPREKYPDFLLIQGNDTLFPALHLVTINESRTLGLQEEKDLTGTELALPLEINKNRMAFLSAWLGVLERGETPVLLYHWDLGQQAGNKCDPCVVEPPSNNMLVQLGAKKECGAHRYFTYHIIPSGQKWMFAEKTRANAQVVFEFHFRSKGFLHCPEAKEYLDGSVARRRREEENLKILIGSEALLLLEKGKE